MNKDELEFIQESNRIEGVDDDISLAQAIEAWKYLKGEKILTVGVMLKTHKILMLRQNLAPNEKGYFRTVDVFIGGHKGFSPREIDTAIHHWAFNVADLVNNGKNSAEVFLERMIKEHHKVYEAIHPFVDGNGRTGRLFMNWERVQLGLPIMVIWESERQEYYEWFK